MSADLSKELAREESKRAKHISDAQTRIWSDSLLEKLGDSPAFKEFCRPENRRADERRKIALMEELAHPGALNLPDVPPLGS